jgi:hypothetical protein
MFFPFFTLAAVSPTRQRAFRSVVAAHLCLLAAGAWVVAVPAPTAAAPVLGHLLLVAGIVEGAVLVGWRLTQLPKSQALEFLLVSPLRPPWVFAAEAGVGLARLALVTLAGLPVLALLTAVGAIDPVGLLLLLLMPFTWGALTGLALAVWAYEPQALRRWGERVVLLLVLFYLAVGVLAGEHLKEWLAWMPAEARQVVIDFLFGFHRYNPFSLLAAWMRQDPWVSVDWTVWLEAGALATVAGLFGRAAGRLKGHFHEWHYQPAVDRSRRRRPPIPDRGALAWWAVRRVTRYSGRINLWLAGGVGLLYALYTVAGTSWPAWLGTQVFQIFDQWGGVPALATGLVLLAAVPAAFQYGLWDSSAQDRCRRLELLLLTRLDGRDFWEAAGAAAWRRGRGYFAVAVLLWAAGVASGQVGLAQALAAASAGVLLWALYFALGFRAFARGLQANGLGMGLTVGLPLLTLALHQAGWPLLAALLPPGGVHGAAAGELTPVAAVGLLLTGAAALVLGRLALTRCDRDLRHWYELHAGRKVAE